MKDMFNHFKTLLEKFAVARRAVKNKFIQKFSRKEDEPVSYEQEEKIILSSIYTPMEPNQNFKFSLKEKLLEKLAAPNRATAPFIKNKYALSGILAVAVIVLATVLYMGAGTFFGQNIPLVSANSTYVPVNFPVRVAFPYNISQEDLQKYFSITPAVEGTSTIENGILTFTHIKFLEYQTEYTIKIAKDADFRMNEDFSIKFTTRARIDSNFFLFENTEMAMYSLSYYEAKPEVTAYIGRSGKFEAKLYKTSADELVKYIVKSDKAYFDGADINKTKMYEDIKKELMDTSEISTVVKDEVGNEGMQKLVYNPVVKDPGMYLVYLKRKGGTETYKFFLSFSRYALSTHRIGDKLITWAIDTASAEGISGGKMTAIDKEGKIVFENNTDEEGISEDIIAPSTDMEGTPNIIVFDINGEKVINVLRIKYSRNIFDVDWGAAAISKYSGYTVTDRPLYTPGGKVQFKSFLRKKNQPDFDGSIKLATVEVSRDEWSAQYETIFKKDYSVNGMGTIAGDFILPSELKSGDYALKVKVGDDVVVTSTFGVEFYVKPEFEVKVSLSNEKIIAGDPFNVDVSANYYFGEPAAGQKVEVAISSLYYGYEGEKKIYGEGAMDRDGKFSLEVKDFGEKDMPRAEWEAQYGREYKVIATVKEASGKSVSGSAIFKQFNSEYVLSDENEKPSWLIKPGEKNNFIYKLSRALDDSEFNGAAGVPVDVKIMSRRWDSMANVDNSLAVFETKVTTDNFGKIKFDYTFEKGGSYLMQLQSTDSKGRIATLNDYLWIRDFKNGHFFNPETGVATRQITLMPDKEEYKPGEIAIITAIIPQEEGDIFLNAYSSSKLIKRSVGEISASGEYVFQLPITGEMVPGIIIFAEAYSNDGFVFGDVTLNVAGKKLNVEIIPSKEKLYPKETVSLAINIKDESGNPVATEGALTVIDKAILALRAYDETTLYEKFYTPPDAYSMGKQVSTGNFVIGMAEKGGCFVTGTGILMADGTQKPIEFVRKGDYILTRMSESDGELVKAKVTKTFEHTVAEYLIINGRIKVTGVHRMFVNNGWKTADEIVKGDVLIDSQGDGVLINSIEKVNAMVKVYNFEVDAYHTYFAAGVYVHNDKGGGDARARSEFLDTAYWNAFVITGSNGKGTVEFAVPDNTTTWVALSKNMSLDTKAGEGQGEFIVSKDMFVRPALPMFFRAGDETEISANIQNTTANNLNVKVSLKAEGLKLISAETANMEIPAKTSVKAVWNGKVEDKTSVKLSFSSKQEGGGLIDNVENTIPVYPSLTKNVKTYTGSAPGEVTFAFDKKLAATFSKAKIILNTSAVSALPEVIEQLVTYPYGCVEQTMSAHLPNLLVKKYHDLLGIKVRDDMSDILGKGLDRLQMYQHNNGSYGWWEDDEANLWMTGYVLEGFIEMKALNEFDREEMYKRTLDFLGNAYAQLNGNEKTYAYYVLGRAAPKTYELVLTDVELEVMQPEFMGYYALGKFHNGDKTEAQRIMAKFILPAMQNNHWEQKDNLYDGHDMSMGDRNLATGVNLLAALTIGGVDEIQVKAIVQWLMNNRTGWNGLWGSTRQSSQVLFALIKYIQKYDELAPDISYSVSLNGKEFKNGKINNPKTAVTFEISANKLLEENNIKFSSEGKGSLFYKLSVENYTSAAKIAQSENAIKIKRTYTVGGEPTTEFNIGDLVNVKIEMEYPSPLAYVMAEDYLPSGFDVINDKLSPRDRLYGYGYDMGWYWDTAVDMRDERITAFDNASYAAKTNWSFNYRARAIRKGTYSVPAASAEPMYDPQYHGIGGEDVVVIK